MNVFLNVVDVINSFEIGVMIVDGILLVGLWGWLKLDYLNGNVYFIVMIMGVILVIIFCKLMFVNIMIKMFDLVLLVVFKVFVVILLVMIVLYVIVIINYIVGCVVDG